MKTPAGFILVACLSVLAPWGSACAQPQDMRAAMPQGRLDNAAYLSEADLLSDEWSPQFQAARRFVRARQCASRAPNPLIYIAPPLGASAVSQRAGSGLDLPLRVSTVANFPNEYLRDVTTLVQTPGVPPAIADKLRLEIQPNYDKLSARVRLLIGEFDPRNCARETIVRARWIGIMDLPITP